VVRDSTALARANQVIDAELIVGKIVDRTLVTRI
jgi:hypothetical protein